MFVRCSAPSVVIISGVSMQPLLPHGSLSSVVKRRRLTRVGAVVMAQINSSLLGGNDDEMMFIVKRISRVKVSLLYVDSIDLHSFLFTLNN